MSLSQRLSIARYCGTREVCGRPQPPCIAAEPPGTNGVISRHLSRVGGRRPHGRPGGGVHLEAWAPGVRADVTQGGLGSNCRGGVEAGFDRGDPGVGRGFWVSVDPIERGA